MQKKRQQQQKQQNTQIDSIVESYFKAKRGSDYDYAMLRMRVRSSMPTTVAITYIFWQSEGWMYELYASPCDGVSNKNVAVVADLRTQTYLNEQMNWNER